MKIIYIEDNASNIALFERICHMAEDDLFIFLIAEDAIKQIAPGTADVIIIDLHLGNQQLDGIDVARGLRDKGVKEPIVAITSYDDLFFNRIEDSGCDMYLQKPISVEGVLQLLNQYRQ